MNPYFSVERANRALVIVTFSQARFLRLWNTFTIVFWRPHKLVSTKDPYDVMNTITGHQAFKVVIGPRLSGDVSRDAPFCSDVPPRFTGWKKTQESVRSDFPVRWWKNMAHPTGRCVSRKDTPTKTCIKVTPLCLQSEFTSTKCFFELLNCSFARKCS